MQTTTTPLDCTGQGWLRTETIRFCRTWRGRSYRMACVPEVSRSLTHKGRTAA